MILPVIAYGDPILKKRSIEINEDFEGLAILLTNMFDTMYNANGVGLAAPQIGKNIRVFIVDGTALESLKDSGFKKVFINPVILNEQGDKWVYEEGCLSVPTIRENIERPSLVKIKYFDENFNLKEEEYTDIKARIIQHEYDHIEGRLFIDHISSLKKQLLKGKLSDISKGKVDVDYPMKYPVGNKRTR